jgi:phosphate:Na+ symporter
LQPINFIFGLGIFLFGMSQLEYGTSKLSESRLRHWLRSSTNTPLASISTGTITTALLQSSSMVSLLVMAFASAGILPLVNAVGIIIGANLGTTITGWLVALFGFKLDLASAALPLFGIAAFTLTMTSRRSRLYYVASAALGIALLLFGLGIMKTSMESIPERWDISILQGHIALVYLAVGVVLAAVIQSSSAVMIMALAAINAEFINLQEAAALVIGADLGTTSTTILGALRGNTIKKQLAFAHLIFNLVVDLSAFFLLLPILPLLLGLARLTDPIYSLVAFHSLINIAGVFVFAPLLKPFSKWIEHVFSRHSAASSNILERVPTSVVDAALTALRASVRNMMLQAVCNNLHLFNLKPEQLKIIQSGNTGLLEIIPERSFNKGYEELKNQEGKVLSYSLRLQAQPLDAAEAAELQRLLAVTRNIVFSNKSLKDIRQDLDELKHSSNDSMRELYASHKSFQKSCYEKIIELQLGGHSREFVLEELADLKGINERHAEEVNQAVNIHAARAHEDGASISIQLNTNWEIKQALATMIVAMEFSLAPETSSNAAQSIPDLVKGA